VRATEVATAALDGERRPTPRRVLRSRHVAPPLCGRRALLAAAAAVLAALAIGIAVVAGGNGDGGAPAQGGGQRQPEQAPQISPVAPADNAATQARNLSGWIRQYTED
jgi:hypothetical protein